MPAPPVHLRPTADLAERVLLPGDPGRALLLAQALLAEPLMFNHARGLWGYTGLAADGAPLTVQATGMGGPSAAIVVQELIDLGARRLVRVGTCGALDSDLGLGDLVVARDALAADGASDALGASERVAADETLTAALAAAAGPDATVTTVVTSDLFYDPDPERAKRWAARGMLAVEMEAAAILTLGALRGVQAGCLLLVSDTLSGGEYTRIGDAELAEAVDRLAALALATVTGK